MSDTGTFFAATAIGDPRELGLAECARRAVLMAAAPPGIDGAGGLLLDASGALRFLSASDATGRVLETAEEVCGEGPCHESFARGEAIVTDLPADPRWPRLSALLSTSPIRSIIGVHVTVDDMPIGSLNAFVAGQRTWSRADYARLHEAAGRLRSAIATALDARLEEQGDALTRQVRAALDNRGVLDRASRILVGSAPGCRRRRQGCGCANWPRSWACRRRTWRGR